MNTHNLVTSNAKVSKFVMRVTHYLSNTYNLLATISCSVVSSAVKSNDLTSLPHAATCSCSCKVEFNYLHLHFSTSTTGRYVREGGRGYWWVGCGSISGALCWLRMQSHKRSPSWSWSWSWSRSWGRPNESGHRQLLHSSPLLCIT